MFKNLTKPEKEFMKLVLHFLFFFHLVWFRLFFFALKYNRNISQPVDCLIIDFLDSSSHLILTYEPRKGESQEKKFDGATSFFLLQRWHLSIYRWFCQQSWNNGFDQCFALLSGGMFNSKSWVDCRFKYGETKKEKWSSKVRWINDNINDNIRYVTKP